MTTKLMIPSLLLGVVMIAGAFAFMPVQEASTVHTTIIGQTGTHKVLAADDADAENAITFFDLTSGTVEATGIICVEVTDVSGQTTSLINLNFNADTVVVLINNSDTEAGACAEFTGKKLELAVGGSSDTVDYSVSWVEG